jgi:hypothetical protein
MRNNSLLMMALCLSSVEFLLLKLIIAMLIRKVSSQVRKWLVSTIFLFVMLLIAISSFLLLTSAAKLITLPLLLLISIRLVFILISVITFHEFESFSILHSWLILKRKCYQRYLYFDWFVVLFIVECDIIWVKAENLSEFVRDISSYFLIFSIFQPNLK